MGKHWGTRTNQTRNDELPGQPYSPRQKCKLVSTNTPHPPSQSRLPQCGTHCEPTLSAVYPWGVHLALAPEAAHLAELVVVVAVVLRLARAGSLAGGRGRTHET